MHQSAKKLLRETLEKLPEDATVEEAVERLLFLAAIEQGKVDADAGRTISHEEVRRVLVCDPYPWTAGDGEAAGPRSLTFGAPALGAGPVT